jgi:hypothetical protein
MLGKGRVFRLSLFAKMLDYPRVTSREFKRIVGYLEKEGVIVVQQGGFLGHSMAHPKIVAILKPLKLDEFTQVMASRTNFRLGDFTVHKTTKRRKCEKCRRIIDYGERYGACLEFGRRRKYSSRKIVRAVKVLCFPCLLEKEGFEGWA